MLKSSEGNQSFWNTFWDAAKSIWQLKACSFKFVILSTYVSDFLREGMVGIKPGNFQRVSLIFRRGVSPLKEEIDCRCDVAVELSSRSGLTKWTMGSIHAPRSPTVGANSSSKIKIVQMRSDNLFLSLCLERQWYNE